MGGEYWCAFVYGFEFTPSCVKLRGSDKFYIGSNGSNGCPIYYCIELKLHTLEDIQKEIDYLSACKSQQTLMEQFDQFANKYGKNPTWRLACIGDLQVDIMKEPSKEYLLGRFHEWTNDIPMYNDDGSFTKDADDCIVCIFREEHMEFMVDRARKLKTFEEIYEMIEDYYTVHPCNPPIVKNKIKMVDLRDNYEKIKAIEEIVNPFFTFEMDDFYGDRGGVPYPKIEELTRLYFKQNGKDKNLVITKEEEQLLLDKIEQLDIGSVEIIKFPYIGRFICVDMKSEIS